MKKIAIIGQGYVGLPLAMEFSRHFQVIGFDIDQERISELKKGYDRTNEVGEEEILSRIKKIPEGKGYHPTSHASEIGCADTFIITVPTPLDKFNAPDLTKLLSASKTVAGYLKKGDTVIYESTVYPGCTEEACVPVLQEYSQLRFNEDFFVGYSPERIIPGNHSKKFTAITKVTSGSTPEIAEKIDRLYQKIITAGTYKAKSIKIAEASKVIENAQRDVNISFINQLALIFDRIGIDTRDVLDAAATKFNFLKFEPGLVGGHCISVDPHYLAHKAAQLGYHPQVILSGRRVNDLVPHFIAGKAVKMMIKKNLNIKNASALILGITFKENCADIRNSKVLEIKSELKEYGVKTDIADPRADSAEVLRTYGLKLVSTTSGKKYDLIILAVAHDEFLKMDIAALRNENSVLYDVKGVLDRAIVDARL